MNISIIGSNSLLATYIIDELVNDDLTLTLYGKTDSSTKKSFSNHFKYFSYPDYIFNLEELLSSDVIIYCAANGVQANQKIPSTLIYKVNAFFPIEIINFLDDHDFKGKWISFGSYFEIGNNIEHKNFTETEICTSMLQIPNEYCSSKRLLTRFLSNGVQRGKYFHFILPTIYGARENPNRLIPYIVNALKNELPLTLSAGKQIRQYIHCHDVARLVKLTIAKDLPPDVYNVAGDCGIQIKELVTMIFNFFSKNAEPYLGTLNTRDENMLVLLTDNQKLVRQLTEWRAQISLFDGIKEYL